jgi:hypothetical protein
MHSTGIAHDMPQFRSTVITYRGSVTAYAYDTGHATRERRTGTRGDSSTRITEATRTGNQGSSDNADNIFTEQSRRQQATL